MKKLKDSLAVCCILLMSLSIGCNHPPYKIKEDMPEANGYDVMVTYLESLDKRSNRELRIGTLEKNKFYGPFIYCKDINGDNKPDEISDYSREDKYLGRLVNEDTLENIFKIF